jgi:hypothetical protein
LPDGASDSPGANVLDPTDPAASVAEAQGLGNSAVTPFTIESSKRLKTWLETILVGARFLARREASPRRRSTLRTQLNGRLVGPC